MAIKRWRKIKITAGRYAICHPDDYDWLIRGRWYWHGTHARSKRSGISMRDALALKPGGPAGVLKFHVRTTAGSAGTTDQALAPSP